ncbi:type 2 lanthipeptide synthetase LanM [Virgibacillus sp. FSP13]
MKGDIPYFCCHANSTDLYHPLGKAKGNFFRVCNFDCLMEKIKLLSEADMESQLTFIRNSLIAQYSSPNHQFNGKKINYENYSNSSLTPNTSKQFLELAIQIGDELEKEAIFGSENDITWLGVNVNMNDQLMFSPVEFDLYDGLLGIGLFYANLYHVSKKEKYKILAEKTIHTAICNISNQLPISAFYGYGAYAYVLSNFSIIFDNQQYLLEARNVLEKAMVLINEDKSLDFLGGSAGLIITCIHIYQKTGESYLLEIANLCGELLLKKAVKQSTGIGWHSSQLTKPLTGLSHGSSGFSWSLAALYSVTRNEKYSNAVMESLNYERSLFDKKHQNWLDLRDETAKYSNPMWCHGATGIGMSRLMLMNYFPNDRDIENEIRVSLDQTLKNGFGGTHSLCHGDLGNLDLLLLVADQFQRNDLEELALKAGVNIASEVRAGKTRYGMPSGAKSPGLMLGKAGIGYGFLRLAFPRTVPSILTLGLNE